jgi:hypothetical protein
MVAGTASMIEQNWQKSSHPSIDSARLAASLASDRLAAARIIVPNTRCSRCLATLPAGVGDGDSAHRNGEPAEQRDLDFWHQLAYRRHFLRTASAP